MEFYTYLKILSTTIMYFFAGFLKISSFGNIGSEHFSKKLNLSINNTKIIIFLMGIYEIISCLILGYGIFTENKKFMYIGSYSLIIFTILNTFIFYIFPINKLYLISNIIVIGSLFLLPILSKGN